MKKGKGMAVWLIRVPPLPLPYWYGMEVGDGGEDFLFVFSPKFMYGVGREWRDGFLFLFEYGGKLDGLFIYLCVMGWVNNGKRGPFIWGVKGKVTCHYDIGNDPLMITWPYIYIMF